MKRWLIGGAALGLTGLALTAAVWGAPPDAKSDPPPAKKDAPRAAPPKKAEPKKPEPVPEAEQGEGVSLTVYNQNFVVVKERRKLELAKGRGLLKFKDVAATIVPETVQFGTLRDPLLARVVEQNYEFDLVSADKLLDKYIDREIAVVTQDGEAVKGTLLSFDAAQLVLKTAAGVEVLPRAGNVKDVQFSALPGGLLTRPTLVWQVDSKSGGKELVKVAYRANGMSWRVDYRANVNRAGDRLDLSGWVTVMNNTGATFADARLKLMAGDVNVVPDPNQPQPTDPTSGLDKADRSSGGSGFVEKSFSEYHLYELGRTSTLRDRETKQIELIDVANIPVTRKYAYHAGYGDRVGIVLEFDNDEKKTPGLGIPLPKGPIRVFQRDRDGEREFAGQDAIDHTPKHEKVEVRLGFAFDLTAERRQTAVRNWPNQSETDVEIRLRNHKSTPVTIEVVEQINGRMLWAILKNSHKYNQRDVNTLVFPVEVKPDSEAVLSYTVRYNW